MRQLTRLVADWVSVPLATCLATLILATTLSTLAAGDHDVLDSNELVRSRGTSNSAGTTNIRCDVLNNTPACTRAGNTCLSCYGIYYVDVDRVAGGGYDAGLPGQGDCGNLYNGICQIISGSLRCTFDPTSPTPMACATPPGAPLKQPLDPGPGVP